MKNYFKRKISVKNGGGTPPFLCLFTFSVLQWGLAVELLEFTVKACFAAESDLFGNLLDRVVGFKKQVGGNRDTLVADQCVQRYSVVALDKA